MYASQDVQNCLVEFNVTWENAFIKDISLECDSGRNNTMNDIRWKLEYLIRVDLGTV